MHARTSGQLIDTVETMGTVVSFDLRLGQLPPDAGWVALARARASLIRSDAIFSTWKPNSPMSRLRRGEISIEDAPREIAEVLALCAQARQMSDGWFDPWAMAGGVDPTGLVKGWAAARAADVLQAAGAEAAMVNAGGDVATFGRPGADRERWRIGIQDPTARDRLVAIACVEGAIATSGCYERGFHLLDPHSGRARADVASATVVGPELALADALATAICVAGRPALDLVTGTAYEALVVGHDAALSASSGFPFAEPTAPTTSARR